MNFKLRTVSICLLTISISLTLLSCSVNNSGNLPSEAQEDSSVDSSQEIIENTSPNTVYDDTLSDCSDTDANVNKERALADWTTDKFKELFNTTHGEIIKKYNVDELKTTNCIDLNQRVMFYEISNIGVCFSEDAYGPDDKPLFLWYYMYGGDPPESDKEPDKLLGFKLRGTLADVLSFWGNKPIKVGEDNARSLMMWWNHYISFKIDDMWLLFIGEFVDSNNGTPYLPFHGYDVDYWKEEAPKQAITEVYILPSNTKILDDEGFRWMSRGNRTLDLDR